MEGMKWLDTIRDAVRGMMSHVARILNAVTDGKLSPNTITLFGLFMHFPIALFIAKGYFGYAVIFLVIFGLFDTLDGELARLQKKTSNAGMLLDATTDRMKEVLLYSGVAYYFVERYTETTQELFLPEKLSLATLLATTVLAAGGSLLVSYVKAKGETALAGGNLSPNEVNRLFQDGLLRFEVRMAILIVGMMFSMKGLVIAIFIIAIFSWLTAISRLVAISRKIS